MNREKLYLKFVRIICLVILILLFLFIYNEEDYVFIVNEDIMNVDVKIDRLKMFYFNLEIIISV